MTSKSHRSVSAILQVALLLPLHLLAVRAARSQDLAPRAFLQLATPPANWRDPADDPNKIAGIAARGDGLVFVGGSERHEVSVVDARDPAAPRLVCTIAAPDDVEGLALDASGRRLFIGGDDQEFDIDGLAVVPIPADPFAAACNFPVTIVPGVESGAFPHVFVGPGGREHLAIAARFCQAPAVRFLDISGAVPSQVGTWNPPNPRMRVGAVVATTRPGGQVIAAVAALAGGVYLLDISRMPLVAPTVIAHFDWTFAPFDFDGDPATVDGCDRNGDTDLLDCGESGRTGDGRRVSSCDHVAFVEVDGRLLLVTTDVSLAGHVRVWSVDEALATCPGPSTCPDDVDCTPTPANCPPTTAPLTCPPWPAVDVLRPLATYAVDQCPLAPWDIHVEGTVLFIAYSDAGAHVIDLAEQGLPSVAGAQPVALAAFASYDTLPGDSDTILENFPCHPPGLNDGCESANRDWDPTPCQATPPANAAFRVTSNAGLRSAKDVDWAGCRLYVSDVGSPDADGLPAPSHTGTAQGLWVLEFGTPGWPADTGATLSVQRASGDATALDLAWSGVSLAVQYHVQRGTLPALTPMAYDHACIARTAATTVRLVGEVTTAPASQSSSYYLVAASCGATLGSAGTDSFGAARPQGTLCP